MGTLPRHFRLIRDVDVSDVSGTGHVADGVIFSDGEAAVHFLGRWPTTTPHPDGIEAVQAIHGHGGATRIVFLDEESEARRELEEARREIAELRAEVTSWRALVSDLDRCVHGRHRIDPCYGCGAHNHGNPHMPTGMVIGHTVHGKEIVVPPEEERMEPRAWKRR
jgi:hypothetical protein